MTLEANLDLVTELKSRLESFTSSGTLLPVDKRLVKIQEDLVVVAAWGNSTEVKLVDTELRQLYKKLVSTTQANSVNTIEHQETMPHQVAGILQDSDDRYTTSIWIYLKALGASILAILAFLFTALLIGANAKLAYLILACGHWASLFVFFKISAPGVLLWKVNGKVDGNFRAAGPWLGVFGGVETGLGFFLTLIGLFISLPTVVGMIVFFIAVIGSPIIGYKVGKSISRQPLGR